MFTEFFGGFEPLQLIVLAISAVLIGINKTALPGIGVLPVIMLTMVFDSKFGTGLQLVLLATGDIIAVAWYRRKADWSIIWKLLPWAWTGLAIGALTLARLPGNERIMQIMIGGIVLGLVLLNFARSKIAPDKIPTGKLAGGFYGSLLGFTTHLANAAGPVAAIYFLAMKLPKEKYMGCNAWFFLIINWTKLPIFIMEGRITPQALLVDLTMIPFLILGGVTGILLLSKMPQKLFEGIIQWLVIICALYLLFNPGKKTTQVAEEQQTRPAITIRSTRQA